MAINFSRHAKRRMRLYRIDETDVTHTVKRFMAEGNVGSGCHEAINAELAHKYGYPLKAVFSFEKNQVTVITVYPVRRERRQ